MLACKRGGIEVRGFFVWGNVCRESERVEHDLLSALERNGIDKTHDQGTIAGARNDSSCHISNLSVYPKRPFSFFKKQPRQPTYHRHYGSKKYHSTPLSNPNPALTPRAQTKEKIKKTLPQKTPQPTYSPNQLIYSVTSLNLTLFSGSAVAGFALTFNGGHISPFAVVLVTGSSLGGGFENTTSPTIHTSAVLYF